MLVRLAAAAVGAAHWPDGTLGIGRRRAVGRELKNTRNARCARNELASKPGDAWGVDETRDAGSMARVVRFGARLNLNGKRSDRWEKPDE